MLVNTPKNRKPFKNNQLKAELNKEFSFMKGVFSMLSLNLHMKGEEDDSEEEIINGTKPQNDTERARSIAELEEKLQKVKSQNNFNLKSKLAKKSLTSKLNKKIKKRERLNKAKENAAVKTGFKHHTVETAHVNVAKPVFNNDGKVVFSKFDFANIGHKDKKSKGENDPRKLLENLKQQEQKLHQLEESEKPDKAKELKEKIAWKNMLQKAEGLKVKDDPTLLKKSIKKMEQKKNQSTKKWDTRIKNVEQKKEDRQKKRKENISKKKKEKKTKLVKAAVKRGRVVL